MKKKILFFTLIVLNTTAIFAQDLPDPISGNNQNVNNWGQNYGPRNTNSYDSENCSPSRFHSGLDYGMVAETQIAYSVEAGDISSFNSLHQSWANIVIGSWRYMHIYVGETTDGLYELVNNGLNSVLIIREQVAKNNYNTIHVYSANQDLNTYDDQHPNGSIQRNILVEHNMVESAPFFRARNYPFGSHLHLDRGFGSWENPLTFLQYNNNTTPEFEIRYAYDNSGIATTINGNKLYGDYVILEAKVDYNTDEDFDRLDIDWKESNGDFKDLVEWRLSGPDHISLTSRSCGISPIAHNVIQRKDPENEIINSTEEGIFTVRNSDPDIEYYKYKFKLRENSYFNRKVEDGKKTMRYRSYDIRQNMSDESQEVKIIDNYKPFVEKIQIIENNIIKYEAGWVNESGSNTFEFQETQTDWVYGNSLSNVILKVFFSEEMNNVNLITNQTQRSSNLIEIKNRFVNSEKTEWLFYLNNEDIIEYKTIMVNNIPLNITGKDMAGNDLISFNTTGILPEVIDQTLIPTRNKNGAFSPVNYTTEEYTYSIPLCGPLLISSASTKSTTGDACGIEGNGCQINFNYNQLTFENDFKVSFETFGIGDIQAVSWDFGDDHYSTELNPVHNFNEEGHYTVRLSAITSEGLTCKKIKHLNVKSEDMGPLDIHFVVHSPGLVNQTLGVGVQVHHSIGQPPYTAKINFGNGVIKSIVSSESGEFNGVIDIRYNSPGEYTASVTVTSSDGLTGSYSQKVYIYSEPVEYNEWFDNIGIKLVSCSVIPVGGTIIYAQQTSPPDLLGFNEWYWDWYAPSDGYNYTSFENYMPFVSHTYYSKGKKVIYYSARYNDEGDDRYCTECPTWAGIIVVDCNETVTNDFSIATFDDWGGVNRYWTGIFNLTNLNSIVDFNNKKIELSACNEITLRPGFSATPSTGNYLHLKANETCIKGGNIATKSTVLLDSINNMFTEEGFDLIETFDFELYPNPTEQYVNLEFMGDYNKAVKVEIFNHVGQMIHNIAVDIQATNTIDVDSWSSGVYLVRVITNEGEVFTKKLVKE